MTKKSFTFNINCFDCGINFICFIKPCYCQFVREVLKKENQTIEIYKELLKKQVRKRN